LDITVPAGTPNSEIEAIVRGNDYSKFLKSGAIQKVIIVQGKLVNVVG